MSSARAMHFTSVGRTFHSARQKVYHRDEGCGAGQILTPDELRAGTGGKALCPECEELGRAKNRGALLEAELSRHVAA